MEERVISLWGSVLVLVALLGLTVLNWRVAYLDLGPWSTVVALLIAATQASLVVLFSMRAWYASRLTKLVIGAMLFWLAILLGLTMTDYLTRGL